jgi:hypothetical protein
VKCTYCIRSKKKKDFIVIAEWNGMECERRCEFMTNNSEDEEENRVKIKQKKREREKYNNTIEKQNNANTCTTLSHLFSPCEIFRFHVCTASIKKISTWSSMRDMSGEITTQTRS